MIYPQKDHARRACKAAIDLQTGLEELKEEIGNKHDIAMSLLNTGVVYQQKGELNQAKEYKEAMEVVNKGLKKHPKNNDLFYARSLLAEKLGDMKLAEKDLRMPQTR